jgi:co-chaperonin GroES (HSP10)
MNLTGQTPNNLVLLKPRILNDKYICASGVELFIDTKFEPEKHRDIVCDVIQVPSQLIYSEKYGNYVTMPWDVDMEVRVGDVAYCDYLAIQNAMINKYDGKSFIHENELYLLIHYMNIFMVLRDGSPIMCNGYVLVEPTYDEYYMAVKKFNDLGLVAPDTVTEMKKVTQYGIVMYLGSRPRNYLNKDLADMELSIGDKVLFDKHADIPLEYEYHQTFMKETKLFRILRKDIMMVL